MLKPCFPIIHKTRKEYRMGFQIGLDPFLFMHGRDYQRQGKARMLLDAPLLHGLTKVGHHIQRPRTLLALQAKIQGA